jgi:hypothetical protein
MKIDVSSISPSYFRKLERNIFSRGKVQVNHLMYCQSSDNPLNYFLV